MIHMWSRKKEKRTAAEQINGHGSQNKHSEWGPAPGGACAHTMRGLNYGGEIEASLRLRGPARTVVASLRVIREVPMRARVGSCRGGGTSGKDYLLLIARPFLASYWCERRGRCLEARRGTATRDSRPRSIVHRGILGSSMHLNPQRHELPPRRKAKKSK